MTTRIQLIERRVAAYMDEAGDRIAEARTCRDPARGVELLDTARALVREAARDAAKLGRIHWLREGLAELGRMLGVGNVFEAERPRAEA